MKELRLARAHVARLDAPQIRIRVPLGLVDGCMEAAVGTQAVLVDDAMHIFQNFGLPGERVVPVWFGVRGEGVEVDGYIRTTSLDRM